MNKAVYLSALLASAAPIAPICAQPAPPAGESATNTAAAESEIVVTGSRVIRNGDDSPTPLTVVSTEQLATASPANIPEALNKLPTFSGVNGQRLSFAPASANLAGNYLNLRNFGASRTLILLDSKRVPPTSADGLTDVNLLPQMLVNRVDVVTGGASSVYGSDGITGVVNFVLDNKFEGVKVQASNGISNYGDYRQTRLGAAFGTKLLGDRGHLIGSFEYFDNPGLLNTDARDQTRNAYFTTGRGIPADPYVISKNVRWVIGSPDGLVAAVLGPDPAGYAGQVFTTGGNLRPFVHGAPTSSPGYESGGDGFYFRKSSVAASLNTKQGFLKFSYDVTPDIEFYTQGTYSESRNIGTAFPFTYLGTFVPSSNAYLAPSVSATLQANGVPGIILVKSSQDFTGTQNLAKLRNWSAMAGFKGKLGDRFDFDISFNHADSLQNVVFVDNINVSKLGAALDSVVSGGQIVCRSSLSTPNAFPGCVPINPFGPASESAAAHDYVTDDTNFRLTNTLDDLAGSITGSPFDTWAGPVNVALSGEYRRATLETVGRSNPADYVFNVITSVPKKSQTVYEVAVEALVPLLKDAPFAKSLDFNGAYRYAHYNTVGTANTWKLGLTWEPVDGLMLRATRSRDFRAPTLTDLFAPAQTFPSGFHDILTNTDANPSIPATTGSNPNLKPEISNALTIGAVFKPSFIPRFSLAIDFYQFKIDNAISAVTPTDPTVQHLCIDSGGTSPFCDLIVRPNPITDTSPANAPTAYFTRPLNAASLETRGVDFELNYGTDVGKGDLSMRGLFSYQPVYRTQSLPGTQPLEVSGAVNGFAQGAVILPRYRFTGFVNYTIGRFSVDLVERWRSSIRRSANPADVFADGKVPSVAYTDVTLTFRPEFAKKSELFINVQNVFNKSAPRYTFPNQSLPGWGGFPSLYIDDAIGRYFTVGIRAQF